jgi:excisionase family DNA binding protein
MRRRRTMFEQKFVEQLAEAVVDRISRVPSVPSKRLFTMAEAAEYIGRSPKAVERLIQRGAIPVTKIDRKRQLDRVALDQIISDRAYFEV